MAGATPEEDILVALGSTGVGCADPIFPAVQARVAADFGLYWIRQQVCRLSTDPPEDFDCSSASNATQTRGNATVTPQALVAPAATKDLFSFDRLPIFDSQGRFDGVFAFFGCLCAILALVVVRNRSKAKSNERVVLSSDCGEVTTYGSIDC